MPADKFLNLAKTNGCSTFSLQRKLRRNAERKDGSRYNAKDSNLLFPDSKLKKYLNANSIATILSCSCKICDSMDREPLSNGQLNEEVRGEHGTVLLLAILVFMGAGFAMRPLYFNGLGRNNELNVVEAFANNGSLKSDLFGHLPTLFGPSSASSVDELANIFCAIFADTKRLFSPPHFKEEAVFREIHPNANLPFLGEIELSGRQSSYARLFKFKIHPEFCSPALSVRPYLKPRKLSQVSC